MRVMVLVRSTKESEAGVMPDTQLLSAMGAFNEELVKAGVLVDGEGLQPTSKGKRVRFRGSERAVVDGPFPGVKDQVAGYWVWNVSSMDEAVEWVKRCPNPGKGESEIEIRPILTLEDFGEAVTPDVKQQDERLRSELSHKGA